MASRKSSILKPRKAREPLQDLNQLLPNNDDEETTTITGITKRKVSFASTNKVKEFESAAECVTLLNTPAYDERFSSISSDSCQSSVLSLSHIDSQKVVTREASIHDDLAAEEEIELTETVGGRIYESGIKTPIDSNMEYTAPCLSNRSQIEKTVLFEVPNQERTDLETSCMETTEVITNNMFSEALISQTRTDIKYEEKAVASECQEMEISPYREVLPVSRHSIFHHERLTSTRKSIFDLPTSQPGFKFRDDEAIGYLPANQSANEENISMDISLPPEAQEEENSPTKMFSNTNYGPKKSIFHEAASNLAFPRTVADMLEMPCQSGRLEGSAAHNLSSPVLSQIVRNNPPYHNLSVQQLPTNQTKYNNSSMQIVSQETETRMEAKFHPLGSLEQKEDVEGSCLLESDQNKTRCIVSDSQLGCPQKSEIGNRTCFDNSAMQLLSQEMTAMVDYETVNKTRYNNSNMQLASQEENAMGAYGIANTTSHSTSNVLLTNQKRESMNPHGISNMYVDSLKGDVIGEYRMADETIHKNDTHLVAGGGNANDFRSVIDQEDRSNSNMQLTNTKGNMIDQYEMFDKTCGDNSNFPSIIQEGKTLDLDGNASQTSRRLVSENKVMNKTCSDDSNIKSTNQEEEDLIVSCEVHHNNSSMQVIDPGEKIATDFQNIEINEEGVNDRKTDEEGTTQIGNVNGDNSMYPMKSVASNFTLIEEVDCGLKTQEMETNHLNLPEEKEFVAVDCKDNGTESEMSVQKLSCENNSSRSSATNDSSSPLTVGVNFSIFQKNKETRVEFSGTIDSNKRERSKSISNVQVNIINNKIKKEDKNIQKLRFSMPAIKNKLDETKPRVYASFVDVDVTSNQKEENHLSTPNDKSLELVNLQSPVLQDESPSSQENFEQRFEEKREQTCAKKRLSSEMLPSEGDEEISSSKRRSISTLQTCATVTELMIGDEEISSSDERKIVNSETREVYTSTHVKESRRESVVCGNQSTFIATENVFVEMCSKVQTSTCINSVDECKETIEEITAPSASRVNESPQKSVNTLKFSNGNDDLSAKKEDNCNVKLVAETTTDEIFAEKLSVTANFTPKSSLSDIELPAKDRSVELRSDNDSERWLAHQVHSTPCHKRRSVKSLGSHSALEDDLIDSLNNPSIVVHIGDSFSHRSLDLGSETVSTLETREGSGGGDSGAHGIETVPSDNVSKVSFVSDWLQNKTGRMDNKLIGVLENHSFSSHKVVVAEEKAVTNSRELPKSAIEENQSEEVKTTSDEALPSQTGTINFTTTLQEIRSSPSEDKPKEEEEKSEKVDPAVVVEARDVSPENKPPEPELDVRNSAAGEVILEEQSILDIAGEALLQQNEVVLDEQEFERKCEHNDVEPVDNAFAVKQGFSDRTDGDVEIDVDSMMDISTNNIDAEEEEKRDTDAGMISHSRPAFETMKNEEVVENTKKKILQKIREEYINENSDWRTKSVTGSEWIFQLSEFRGLGWSLCLPLHEVVKIMPALVVKIEPCSTHCSASFQFINEPLPDRYREVMKIGIRALRQKCQKKIKTICQTVEDVPCLLNSLAEDVTWMIHFARSLKKIGGSENVRYKDGNATFDVFNYKNLILFHVHVDLNNLRNLSVKDVKVEQKIGKIDSNSVLKIFSESGRDYDFFSKFVKKLTSTFGD